MSPGVNIISRSMSRRPAPAAVPEAVCRWWLCPRCPGEGRCILRVNIIRSSKSPRPAPATIRVSCEGSIGRGLGPRRVVRSSWNIPAALRNYSAYAVCRLGRDWHLHLHASGHNCAQRMVVYPVVNTILPLPKLYVVQGYGI